MLRRDFFGSVAAAVGGLLGTGRVLPTRATKGFTGIAGQLRVINGTVVGFSQSFMRVGGTAAAFTASMDTTPPTLSVPVSHHYSVVGGDSVVEPLPDSLVRRGRVGVLS